MSSAVRKYDLVVYGAYGYTGKLITEVCKSKGIRTLISGRSRTQLEKLSADSGFDFEAVDINDHQKLVALLSNAPAVLHCAGPFSLTAKQMVTACLEAGTHYLDITGEHEVMSALHELDKQAQSAGIMIMPGVGFDVVPTDCMAAHLKNRLPHATSLQLAFAMVPTGVSRGTAKTALQSFGKESLVRRDGKLVSAGPQPKTLTIDFGTRKLNSVCISWGDIFSSWITTGIPTIEVYMAASPGLLKSMKFALRWSGLFRLGFIRNLMSKGVDRRPAGPSEEILKNGRSLIYGKAWTADGQMAESRLTTSNGYRLTADMAVLIATKVIAGNFRKGFSTPAGCYGADLVLELPESSRSDG